MDKDPAARFSAAVDLAIAVSVTLICGLSIPAVAPLLKRLGGVRELVGLALFQFVAEGTVVLVLLAVRREQVSDFGFTLRGVGKSLPVATVFAIAYDAALSMKMGELVWVPLRRHLALRLSLGMEFPLNVIGIAATIAVWGFFEAFYGVFFANRLNRIAGHAGRGWLSPGALGFGVFNGVIHAGLGQGMYGFITSFASGYAIAVIPSITRNSWGSALFQTLTNSVGSS